MSMKRVLWMIGAAMLVFSVGWTVGARKDVLPSAGSAGELLEAQLLAQAPERTAESRESSRPGGASPRAAQTHRRVPRLDSDGPGVPDYAAIAARQKRELPALRKRLDVMKTDGWNVHTRIDYLLLRSEMDELDFTLRVWRPTTRNASFYVNAAISHVARTLTGGRYMRGAVMPYTKERAQAVLQSLADTERYSLERDAGRVGN